MVLHEKIWRGRKAFRVVQDTAVRVTEEFQMEVGLYQETILSLCLFEMVIDGTDEARQGSPWTKMFAEDIVICRESMEQVKENLHKLTLFPFRLLIQDKIHVRLNILRKTHHSRVVFRQALIVESSTPELYLELLTLEAEPQNSSHHS